MFRLSRKKIFVRLSIICVFIATAISVATILAVRNNDLNSNAATGQDSTVTVNGGPSIYYGGGENEGHTQTYSITNSSGETIRAYCAEPSAAWPGDSNTTAEYASSTENNKMIKLMIYMRENYDNAVVSPVWDSVYFWDSTDNGQRYAWAHAIVGAIYTNGTDYRGVTEENIAKINNSIAKLRELVNNNSDVWIAAQNYQLFLGRGEGDKQDMVWIENHASYGSIQVQKCDTDLPTGCLPQGNANFRGMTFKVYNDSGSKIYNPKTDQIYADGQEVASGTTNANGQVTFSNLLSGGVRYLVKETATNATYQLTAGQQTSTLDTSGQTNELIFKDKVVVGNLEVNKLDAETNSCTVTTEGLSFNGTTFQLINRSTNPVYYNGQKINPGAVVDTKQLSNGSCKVTFTGLPYGEYGVKETAAGEGYVVNNTEQRANVPASSGQAASLTFKNQPIRGDVKFVKKDPANNKVMGNVLFMISSIDKNNEIKETHVVVSNENGVIDTSASFALHTFHTNGYDSLYDELAPITFSGFGTWFGKDSNGNALSPNDNLGALPYGTYIIQELRCNSNTFCTNIINQKATITINSANQVVNLGDWDNACTKFSLETTATDAKDDDKYVEIGEQVTIKDKVDYCLKAKVNFTIKGVLMDKATGEKLLIDGKPVESSVKVNSQTDCGETEMNFTFNASALGGKEVVVFEYLYYEDELMTSHEDIDDEDQTVEMVYLKTIANNNLTGEKTLPHDSYAEIKDVVKYCVKPGFEYTIKGVLMNKETGEVVKFNDEPVTSTVTFTPEEACGELEMIYKLNTTGLEGSRLVIFESLFRDEEKLVEHSDLGDEDQSVVVEMPVPDTGAPTKKDTSATEAINIAFIVGAVVFVGLGGYISMRVVAKRRIFRKKVDF